MNKSPEELYQERAKRVDDALNLRMPDRVPLEIAFGYFPARYNGITCAAAYYDYDKWLAACTKTVSDFGADLSSTQLFFPGSILEQLDPKVMMWPGFNSPENHGHQYLEGEFMKAEDYPAFLNDPGDYILRRFMPRSLGVMAPFEQLAPLAGAMYGYYSGFALADAFSKPEVAAAIEKLQKIGNEMRQWAPKLAAFGDAMKKLGFPPFSSGFAQAPFDAISDHLRGMRGSMLDMYRQPENILEGCDKILKRTLSLTPPPVEGSVNAVAIPLHRGSEGFMSIKQFEKFYWPGLKGLILGLMEKGLRPLVFFEGDYTSRLEYLLELPKGSIFAHMDTTDIVRCHEVIGGHLCYSGNLACSLLQTASPAEVREHTKKMLDVCAKDGGFIMSTRSPVDDAEPACLKSLIDTTIEYGGHR
jgi:hypothetical protein